MNQKVHSDQRKTSIFPAAEVCWLGSKVSRKANGVGENRARGGKI